VRFAARCVRALPTSEQSFTAFSLLLFLWGGLFHFHWFEQVADGELQAAAVPSPLSGGVGGAVVLWEYF